MRGSGYRSLGQYVHQRAKFVAIGQTVAEIWRFFAFSKRRRSYFNNRPTMGRPFSSKLPLPVGGSRPPWFLGPSGVDNPNCISIGLSVFAELTTVTDRQTDRQTTLLGCNNRPLLADAATRPTTESTKYLEVTNDFRLIRRDQIHQRNQQNVQYIIGVIKKNFIHMSMHTLYITGKTSHRLMQVMFGAHITWAIGLYRRYWNVQKRTTKLLIKLKHLPCTKN